MTTCLLGTQVDDTLSAVRGCMTCMGNDGDDVLQVAEAADRLTGHNDELSCLQGGRAKIR